MFNCKNCPYFTKRLVDLKRHKKYEEIHNLRINRKIGTPNHLKMALKSHVNWNSLNTGFISAKKMRINSPMSSMTREKISKARKNNPIVTALLQ